MGPHRTQHYLRACQEDQGVPDRGHLPGGAGLRGHPGLVLVNGFQSFIDWPLGRRGFLGESTTQTNDTPERVVDLCLV